MGDEKPTTLQVLLPLAPLISATAAAVAAVVSCSGFFYSREEARASRAAIAEQRMHGKAVFEASQVARLAFDRMTTQANIQPTADGWDISRELDGGPAPQPDDFGRIRNFGPGVALNCSAEFTVIEINGERLATDQVSSVKCSPMNILPNGAAHLYSLPSCVANDKDRTLRWAKGHVTFTCFTNAGKKESSSQKVHIQPNYEKGTVLLIFEGPEFLDHGGWL